MPWWRVIDDELVGADRVYGPYGSWTLTDDTPGGQGQGGWRKFPTETAARNGLGVPHPVKGVDRAVLDRCIADVQGVNLRAALINLRRESPDPEQVPAGGVTVKEGGRDG